MALSTGVFSPKASTLPPAFFTVLHGWVPHICTHLGPEVGGGAHVFVLRLHGAPWVVDLEAFIAVAGTAVHAALGGLLGGRLAEVTHDGRGRPSRLPVPLHDRLQGEVTEQATDPSFSKVHVVLTARTRERSRPRSQGVALPACVISKPSLNPTSGLGKREDTHLHAGPQRGIPKLAPCGNTAF